MRTPSAETLIQRYSDYVLEELMDSKTEATPVTEEAPQRHQLMTTNDVKDLLNVSRRTVWELVRRKALFSIKVGGQLRFRREWIELYLQQQTRNGNGTTH